MTCANFELKYMVILDYEIKYLIYGCFVKLICEEEKCYEKNN